MSRYEWTKDKYTFSIGYDRPMRTFFAQIHDESLPDEDDNCVLWLGGNYDQYPSLPEMLDEFPIDVPPELQSHLQADCDGTTASSPLPPDVLKVS